MPVRFSKVDDNVYRGGAPSPNDIAILKDKYNIKKIISLDQNVADRIAPIVNRLGMEHIIFPMTDGHGPNVDKLPEEVKRWTDGGPVYVHCLHGKDRTSMACATYRILVNGWDTDDAIVEAYKFGMGRGLSPKVRNSYYEAVRNIGKDSNDTADIVSKQRDDIALEQHPPAANDQAQPSQQQSFAPFMDVEQAHLFYRGDDRVQRLLKLASYDDPILLLESMRERAIKKQAGMQVFKYGPPSDMLKPNQMWSSSMHAARQDDNEDENARMYVATVSEDARVEKYPHESVSPLLHSAMMNEADAVIFTDGVFVINPDALVDIKEIGQDANDAALSVGEFDNYVGLAQHSYPGVSGPMGGLGGAGVVESGNSFQL